MVVPTLNEQRVIGRCLASIRRAGPCQLIVVDGGSCDRTVAIAKKYADVVFVQKKPGVAAARNEAVERAKGRYVAFTDADCVVPPDWLRRIRHNLRRCVCVGGPLKPLSHSLRHRLGYFLTTDLVPTVSSIFGFYQFHGSNMAVRRRTFEKAGGFNPQLRKLEDNELANRLKMFGKVFFDRRLYVFSDPRRFEKYGYVRMWCEFFRGYVDVYLKRKKQTDYLPPVRRS